MSKELDARLAALIERCDETDRLIVDTRRFADLESENAKLRELVRHLRECTRHNVCAACKYAEEACDFDYDMRELGVDA